MLSGEATHKKVDTGAAEMVQQLRACAGLVEGPSLVPSTYIRWFTTTCNSSSRVAKLMLFWPLWLNASMLMCARVCAHTL